MTELSFGEEKKEETSVEAEQEGKVEEKAHHSQRQSFVAVVIILVGLLAGSILVDVAQLVAGQGFSQRALRGADVIEAAGRSWVAYDEPRVNVSVITDQECEECAPDQALVFLRRYVPTMNAREIDVNSDEGKRALKNGEIKTLPAFVFDSGISETAFYSQAQSVFQEKNGGFVLDTAAIGLPTGKYLALPQIEEGRDIIVGDPNASVKMIEFSDFQCPYCNALHPTITQALKEFDGKVQWVYKHLPLSFHPQANNAALASECANEQGKFQAYADILFKNQDAWGQTEGTAAFKQYAQSLRLNATQFNKCLDSKQYQDKVDADSTEAKSFGVSGTPGTFIGEQFLGGAAAYETVKSMIEKELEKTTNSPSSEAKEDTKS